MSEAAAGRLVIELGPVGTSAELERALRSALRDPTLIVLHWSESTGAYLDAAGKPAALPSEGAKRAVNELLRRTVKERSSRGQAVYLVDAFAAIDPQREMADAAHPNDAGYERIGAAFADVLLPLLGVDRIE